jgi:4-hydroxy-tetrahydrodipicolinate synthase
MTILRGIWSAAITPANPSYAPDATRAIAYYRELLANGCDGINLLGTTGQAMSFDVAARRSLMEAIGASDLPHARFMCGTGAASLGDAIALTRTASAARFSAALVMPPFFYRDASDDGIVRFFDALIGAADAPILLYNFPRMSGITFHLELVTRLLAEFPNRILGIKDSSNTSAYQRAVIERHPELAIFPGSEAHLLEALDLGAAGCISGSVALWAPIASEVYHKHNAAADARLTARRASLDGAPLIPQVHARVAAERKDDAWKRVVPPLVSAS